MIRYSLLLVWAVNKLETGIRDTQRHMATEFSV